MERSEPYPETAHERVVVPTLAATLPVSNPGRGTWTGVVRVFLAEALVVPTGLLTAAFLTRSLGPGPYGRLMLALAIVAWVEWGVASVLARAAIKLVSEADDWRPVGSAMVRANLLLGAVAGLTLWLAAGPLAALLGEPELSWLLRVLALDVPLFSLAQAHRNVLTGLGGFAGRAISGAGRFVTRLLLVLTLVGVGLSVTGAALAFVGASLVELLICRAYVRPPLVGAVPVSWKPLLAVAAPLFLMGIGLRLFERLDIVMLKVLGGTAEEAGYYGAAQNMAMLPALVALSLSPVLLSNLGRLLRSGDDASARILAGDALRAVLLIMPSVAAVAACAPEIIETIFGVRFAPAATPLTLLLLGSWAMLIVSVASTLLIAANRANLALALSAPLVPLALAGHPAAIPRWGLAGAAIVTLAGGALGALAQLVAVDRLWGVRPTIRTTGRAVLAALAVVTLAGLSPATGTMLLLVKLPALGLVTLIVVGALGEFSRAEVGAAGALLAKRPANPREEAPVP